MNRGVTSANNTIRQPTTGPSSGGAYPTRIVVCRRLVPALPKRQDDEAREGDDRRT